MGKSKGINIILIGFMGSGKTTVGKIISESLEYVFLDTDEVIEQEEKRSIKEIFSKEGETYFRNLETKVLQNLLPGNYRVISTGGGMPLRVENQALLEKLGFIVYLKTSVASSIERLNKDSTRPLLQGENLEDKISMLQTERDPIYRKIAHMILETDNKSPKMIASEILLEYDKYRDNFYEFRMIL